MKSYFKVMVGPLIVGILLAVFTYYLNYQKVDVRYLLYESIPVDISGTTSATSIQQIIVVNMGNVKAERIIVDITENLKDYDIVKYSQSDVVNQYHSQSNYELIYPELPPQGSFRIIFKSQGTGIKKDNIIVKHNKGVGTEILEKTNPPLTLWIYITGFLIFILMGIRETLIYGWDYNSRTIQKADLVLKRTKKPFYITKGRWDKIRSEALETKVNERYISTYNITDSPIFEMLNQIKPDYLSDQEWNKLKDTANTLVFSKLLSKISESDYVKSVIDILRIEKPNHFSDNNWQDIKEKAIQKFIYLKKVNFYGNTASRYLVEINSDHPQEIPEIDWGKYIDHIKKEYYNWINMQIYSSKNACEFINDIQIDCLDLSSRNYVSSRAYNLELEKFASKLFYDPQYILQCEKPKWIKESDYKNIINKASKLAELDKNIEIVKKKMNDLSSITKFRTIPIERPQYFNVEEWNKVCEIYKEIDEINNQRGEVANKEIQLNNYKDELIKEKLVVENLKNTVLNQLHLIDEILKDPNSINKIEEYESVFATGNFKNIKKVAEILLRSK